MKKIGIFMILICSFLLVSGCEKKETEKKEKKEEETEIINPLTEVSTKQELEDMVGFSVPTIEEKEIITYIAIGNTGSKDQARILYQDGSEFDMKKGKVKDQEEISGIYGAEKKDSEKIEETKVDFYTYEETTFAVWSDEDYTYSYSMQNTDIEVLKDNIKLLVK